MSSKIIAEIASSHNGDINLGKAMIRAAAETGVDYVKFQSWQAQHVADTDPDRERYKSLELTDEAHYVYKRECESNNVTFLTSIFDRRRIPFLKKLGLDIVKIPSTYCSSPDMLRACRKYFAKIILSVGMSNPEEVRQAVQLLQGHDVTLLHCVSLYPVPPEKVNLRRMVWLKSLAPRWGLSDHSHGADAAKVAIAMGAHYVEKHFTLSKYLPQIPHRTSDAESAQLITTHSIADEPAVFREICAWRDQVNILMGTGQIDMLPEELAVRKKYVGRLGT